MSDIREQYKKLSSKVKDEFNSTIFKYKPSQYVYIKSMDLETPHVSFNHVQLTGGFSFLDIERAKLNNLDRAVFYEVNGIKDHIWEGDIFSTLEDAIVEAINFSGFKLNENQESILISEI